MIPHVGSAELIIIFLVALIVFGPKKLPEIGKSIGQGLRELKKASRDVMSSIEHEDEPEPPRASQAGDSAGDSKEIVNNAADCYRDT